MATNQQRREAAKRKLDRQIAHRAEQAKRRKIVGIGVTIGAVMIIAGLVVFVATRERADVNADAGAQPGQEEQAPPPVQIPTERAAMPQRPQPLADPVSCQYPAGAEPAAKPATPPAGEGIASTGTVSATVKTSAGDIPVTLDKALAPCTVNSFVGLAQQGYYNDTECHRLGTDGLQMLQCGDPTASGSGGPGYTVQDENFPELTYGRGVLAMAKTAQPNSGGSQFFMVYGDAQLQPDYTVFGSISDEGLKVLDEVAKAGVDPAAAAQSQDGTGKPKTPVKFTEVSVNA
ncbi:peptidylprolyl isomerase [Amycolatopsis antarctica]|uniref:Peptidylprolyl isomerase n=1 Tax=Amycolatopsis antarctica TaxID=1854586 RepID=A0A263D4N4_9PSEU|nr:peptidylprolyl isomerase [Amycolatopsis antarctica]OZM72436.1 peptidylprolyl isomerase [Amycolatopsis antarctica]